jgi:hypothetical protein
MTTETVAPPTTAPRESGCPVHFVWDGAGMGRPIVRFGFMLLLAAGLWITAAALWPQAALRVSSPWVLGAAVGVWGLGQAVVLAERCLRRR